MELFQVSAKELLLVNVVSSCFVFFSCFTAHILDFLEFPSCEWHAWHRLSFIPLPHLSVWLPFCLPPTGPGGHPNSGSGFQSGVWILAGCQGRYAWLPPPPPHGWVKMFFYPPPPHYCSLHLLCTSSIFLFSGSNHFFLSQRSAQNGPDTPAELFSSVSHTRTHAPTCIQ